MVLPCPRAAAVSRGQLVSWGNRLTPQGALPSCSGLMQATSRAPTQGGRLHGLWVRPLGRGPGREAHAARTGQPDP